MADRKITELSAMSAGTQATGDLLTIVDVSEAAAVDKNKKITVESLFKGIPSNVGIGTASPSANLEVFASSNPQLRVNSTSHGYLDLSNYANGAGVMTSASHPLRLGTANTERMRIDPSGNLGLGTSSPAAKLDVAGNQIFTAANPQIQFNAGGPIIRLPSANTLAFLTDSSNERLRIDSSGTVGIGCVPNSFQSGFDALQIGGNLVLNVDSTGVGAGVYMNNNVYRDSGNSRWEYINTDEASQYYQANGEHVWRSAASGSANAAITWLERMRIDSSGKVGIGTSSPGANLEVKAASIPTIRLNQADTYYAPIKLVGNDLEVRGSSGSLEFYTGANNGDSSTERLRIDSLGALIINSSSTTGGFNVLRGKHPENEFNRSEVRFGCENNSTGVGFLAFATGSNTAAERVRIDSSGRLLVGCTSFPSASVSGFGVEFNGDIGIASGTTSADRLAEFFNPNGRVGGIVVNGTNTTFETSSDYRLKENVIGIVDGITRVKQLSPKRFNFIADDTTTVDGFIAHEAQTVVPEAVTGTHNEVDGDGNAVMQGIDQSKLVPLLTAALQEAIAKIETLEQRLSDAGIA